MRQQCLRRPGISPEATLAMRHFWLASCRRQRCRTPPECALDDVEPPTN